MLNGVSFIPNYLHNPEEIVKLAELESSNFISRGKGSRFEFNNEKYGNCVMDSLPVSLMSCELKNAILDTIDKERFFDGVMPSEFLINRYYPGAFLPRHVDAFGDYWKFNLVFLKSSKPHLKLYDEDNPKGVLVPEEVPGTLVDMPLDMEHEVTLIEENEDTRYTLVFIWQI